MMIKAQVSFAGAITMRQGEERELADDSVALQDLLQAGYVVGIDTANAPTSVGEVKQSKAAEKPAKAAKEVASK